MIPKAAGLINLHLLHSISQPMTALTTISAGLPHKPSAPFLFPGCLLFPPPCHFLNPQLYPSGVIFLKSLPIAMPRIYPLLPAVRRTLPNLPLSSTSQKFLLSAVMSPQYIYLCCFASSADQSVHTHMRLPG